MCVGVYVGIRSRPAVSNNIRQQTDTLHRFQIRDAIPLFVRPGILPAQYSRSIRKTALRYRRPTL